MSVTARRRHRAVGSRPWPGPSWTRRLEPPEESQPTHSLFRPTGAAAARLSENRPAGGRAVHSARRAGPTDPSPGPGPATSVESAAWFRPFSVGVARAGHAMAAPAAPQPEPRLAGAVGRHRGRRRRIYSDTAGGGGVRTRGRAAPPAMRPVGLPCRSSGGDAQRRSSPNTGQRQRSAATDGDDESSRGRRKNQWALCLVWRRQWRCMKRGFWFAAG